MTKTRADLHKSLVEAIGNRNVYFQPPESIKIKYPCVVYSRSRKNSNSADNLKYLKHTEYDVVYISKNPDDDAVIENILSIPYSSHSRSYTADNLHHDAFTIRI